ncbi:glycosyltransferase [Pollutimonas bauzanensis]|jgi:GT2 family glycosyltransferase|uniref:glycosyltransferase family 2 protein n=1 Tax=Pollutimonas bauzanensis TaxID=658167 RepID=UPI003340C0F9
MQITEPGRATIVVLTHNKHLQAISALEYLCGLPGQWPIVVVDNGSTDGTPAAIAARYPSIMLIRARRNLGAAARNIGVAFAQTPYVAFCDSDTEWEPGALERAVALLDDTPQLAVVSACVQVGATGCPAPACLSMAQSPLAREQLPGPQLLGFTAGACVMRTCAFYQVGGYWPPFFQGGEEALMALDLVERGWRIVYANDVVARYFPSLAADSRLRERLLIRNAIWVAWMRRPVRAAWRQTSVQWRAARDSGIVWSTMLQMVLGLPRALRNRKVISPAVESMQALLESSR